MQNLILSWLAQILFLKNQKKTCDFLFALFPFLANLNKWVFNFFLTFGTPGNSTLGLSVAEKLSGSREKNQPIISRGTDFRAQKNKQNR